MVQVNDIFGASMTAQSFNQATRWTNTKEEHCSKIITLMAEYCLCQRVKPIGAPGCPFTSEGDFMDALKAHHAVMTAAMKAKQSTDPSVAAALECAPTYQHHPRYHHPPTYPRTFRATRTSTAHHTIRTTLPQSTSRASNLSHLTACSLLLTSMFSLDSLCMLLVQLLQNSS